MKIVISVPCYADHVLPNHREIAAVAPEGIEIVPLPSCVPGPPPPFPEIDRLWKRRDDKLFSYYRKIIKECKDADVFLSISAGIHPELLEYLPTFNCYHFCDDPEDSPWQSAKVARAYDGAFYGNIASSFQYQSWGCQRHSWLPFLMAPVYWPEKSLGSEVLNAHRNESVVFVGGLDDYSSYRRKRLEKFANCFPDGAYRGRGWPAGRLDGSISDLYLKSRIGFNLHRTTGPINLRMFQLPAHGVMQICDNKTGLGQIFELGKEVEGFDTIDEAIELTKYYLAHDTERESIAKAGYERFWKDYHTEAILESLRHKLIEWGVKPGERKRGVKHKLPSRNTAYFFGVAREKMQTEANRLIRSAKAAKREYLRKDPWWKIYERVFTSEAVYLPDYGDSLTEFSKPDFATDIKEEQTPSHMVRARQGAIRWAMTQLVGKAVRIGVSDPQPDALVNYLGADLQRRIEVLSKEEQESLSLLDLFMCIPSFTKASDLVGAIRKWAKIAPRAVYGFPCGEFPPTQAGEVYWLLKSFYGNVAVFHMPNPVVPWLEPIKDWNDSGSLVVQVRE